VRHVEGAEEAIAKVTSGDAIQVVSEPDNRFNPKALKLRFAGEFIGYLPDYLASELTCAPESVEVRVRKVNAPPASVHQRLLLDVGFPAADPLPFTGETYRPLPVNASPVAA